ncbi:MAG: Double zinc ribbon [Methanomassiliicoccales archaeon PtaB.Bin134]|nr:MAG: Double zinc ribbon [Methanomassiliicoccales archaeon PtaB.Bin134]
MVDKKAGFKECPKCGLRNRPNAVQCDFCGQSLVAAEDWQHHLKDLESLNKMELRKPVDARTSRRIEATIIRKDAPTARTLEIREADNLKRAFQELESKSDRADVKVEERRDHPSWRDDAPSTVAMKSTSLVKEPDLFPPEEGSEPERPPEGPATDAEEPGTEPSIVLPEAAPEEEIRTEPTSEGPAMELTEPKAAEVVPSEETPEPEAERDAEPMVPTDVAKLEVMAGPAIDVPSNEVVTEEAFITVSSNAGDEIKVGPENGVCEKGEEHSLFHTMGRKETVTTGVFALGILTYLIVLGLTAVGFLDVAWSMGGGAISSVMVIYGGFSVLPSFHRKDDAVVFICPHCHEKVDQGGKACPACGADFTSDD